MDPNSLAKQTSRSINRLSGSVLIDETSVTGCLKVLECEKICLENRLNKRGDQK